MASNFYKYYLTKINILNFLICLIPLTLIFGNLATNINITLICIIGIFLYGSKIFFYEKKIYIYLLYFFFIYLILITFYNNLPLVNTNPLYKEHIYKSLFFLRFLLLFLVISKLIETNKFNTRLFFISCAFFSFIISIDLIIQVLLKKNILGFPITYNRPSSFFNKEHIAGGYLKNFIIFFIFFVSLYLKKNYLSKKIILLFALFFIPILLTGNRMPTIIYASYVVLFLFLEKKFKDIFISILLIATIFISIVKFSNLNNRLETEFKVFKKEVIFIYKKLPTLFIKNEITDYTWNTGYLMHFNSGIQIWKKNKLFGNGLKSFRLKCSYSYENNQTCNTHPHNYLIELLVDVGIIGAILIYGVVIFGLLSFFKYYLNDKNINSRFTSIVFFLIIFFEFFPLRSTGSFFTTNNSIIIFLILPILLNIKKTNKL